MSDESSAADAIAESVSGIAETVDEASRDLDLDDAAGEGMREEVGREIGARLGRELGGLLGRGVAEIVASGFREGKSVREVADDVRQFLVDALSELLRDADLDATTTKLRDAVVATSPEDLADSASEGASEATDEASEAADEVSEAAESTDDEEAESETESEAEAEAESETESEAESTDGDDQDVASADELRDLREETFRELLDVMAYDELQSIAKEVDVKANLDRETMTERIIEEFDEDSAADSGDDAEE